MASTAALTRSTPPDRLEFVHRLFGENRGRIVTRPYPAHDRPDRVSAQPYECEDPLVLTMVPGQRAQGRTAGYRADANPRAVRRVEFQLGHDRPRKAAEVGHLR